MRPTRIIIISALVASWLGILQANAESQVCFQETGYCIEGRFLAYWQQNGGLPVFGYPIGAATPQQNRDDGETYLTQGFERNRFELHPENAAPYDVLLGRLGNDRLQQLDRAWQAQPKDLPSATHYFAATGHAIDAVFWQYWSDHGLDFGDPGVTDSESLALFGYPISSAAMEVNSTNGKSYLTQWFERARFEYHPGEEWNIQLGLLSNEIRAGDAGHPEAGQPLIPTTSLSQTPTVQRATPSPIGTPRTQTPAPQQSPVQVPTGQPSVVPPTQVSMLTPTTKAQPPTSEPTQAPPTSEPTQAPPTSEPTSEPTRTPLVPTVFPTIEPTSTPRPPL